MKDILAGLLLVSGSVFMVLAALGVARMPDVFLRMQASTKANTLGIAGLIVGSALHFGDLGSLVRALVIIAFVYVTTPVAAHVIARAAYLTGVSVWERTSRDEWHKEGPGATK